MNIFITLSVGESVVEHLRLTFYSRADIWQQF
jgi:hypothetical protein